MAITVGVDTWVTVAEADTYFTNRIGATSWFALPIDNTGQQGGTSKESLLVTAFYWLLYDPNYLLSPSLTNDEVKIAQMESALFLLLSYEEYRKREAKKAGGVTDFTYSKWQEELKGELTKPKMVDDLLNNLGLGGGNFLVDITVED